MHFRLVSLTPFLTFLAFLLLLLVSVSVPITKTIYLFKLTVNVGSSLFKSGAEGSAEFGLWGYCLSAVQVSVLGLDHSSSAQCSKPELGYDIDSTVAKALGVSGLTDVISHALTGVLVLHPIICAFTFLTMLTSFFIVRRYEGVSRLASFVTLALGGLSAFLCTIIFIIDISVVATVRNKVGDISDGTLDVDYGNAVWMALVATIALWGAVIGAASGMFMCGPDRKFKIVTY